MDPIRSFIGISVDTNVADQLSRALVPIQSADQAQAVRWIPTANWHLTLAFLGDQPQDMLVKLSERLVESLADIAKFKVSLRQIDSFPDARSRIVAAMAQRSPELDLLNLCVNQTVNALPMTTDKKPFRPHITLGRIKRGRKVSLSPHPINVELQVQHVSVFSSQLTQQGSIYTALAQIPLARII